jgi:hypothetical protein
MHSFNVESFCNARKYLYWKETIVYRVLWISIWLNNVLFSTCNKGRIKHTWSTKFEDILL